MTKQNIIQSTLEILNHLPENKAEEINHFAHFISKKYDEELINKNIQKLSSTSNSLDFLNEEEVVYEINDLKQIF